MIGHSEESHKDPSVNVPHQFSCFQRQLRHASYIMPPGEGEIRKNLIMKINDEKFSDEKFSDRSTLPPPPES